METSKQYGWIRFYTDLADKLLEYRSNHPALVQIIKNVFLNVKIDIPTLDEDGKFSDIDPFTVIGLVNKGITMSNRRKILAELASQFSLTPMGDDDGFDGVPILNNLKATFYCFASERGEHDIENLWALFAAALDYSSDSTNEDRKQTFISKYDLVREQKGIKWNITMGLFWIRPYSFVSLDDKNRAFFQKAEHLSPSELAKINHLKTSPSGAQYIQLCQHLLAEFQNSDLEYKSFPELSQKAWLESQAPAMQSNASKSSNQDKDNAMPKQTHDALVASLKELLLVKKQIILTGAPGTGKTYLAKEIAALMLGKSPKTMIADAKAGTEKRYQFRQFHPGYDYSDFVEGLKPHLEGGKPTFVPTPGIFMQFCLEAAADSSELPYVMVIDEINRADLSRVFGELFYGLEKDYRGQPIPTQYSYLENRKYIEKGKQFEIPPNVYIIGTMNDIDRSVESMDFALRRRFAWQEITVEDSEIIIEKKVPQEVCEEAIRVMHDINENIIKGELGLGSAYYLGGAYFQDVDSTTRETWEKLWKYNIKVILTEYLRASRKNRTLEKLKDVYESLLPKSED